MIHSEIDLLVNDIFSCITFVPDGKFIDINLIIVIKDTFGQSKNNALSEDDAKPPPFHPLCVCNSYFHSFNLYLAPITSHWVISLKYNCKNGYPLLGSQNRSTLLIVNLLESEGL